VKKSIALGLAGLALVASALAAQDPARRGGQGGKRKPPPQDGIVKPSMNDTVHGAVWIQLANKSMLMNQKVGRRMADECQSPAQVAVAEAMKKGPAFNLLDGPAPSVARK
jgi:hypothetical protein